MIRVASLDEVTVGDELWAYARNRWRRVRVVGKRRTILTVAYTVHATLAASASRRYQDLPLNRFRRDQPSSGLGVVHAPAPPLEVMAQSQENGAHVSSPSQIAVPWSWVTRDEVERLRAATHAFHAVPAEVASGSADLVAFCRAATDLGRVTEDLLEAIRQRRPVDPPAPPPAPTAEEDVALYLGGARRPVSHCIEPGCGIEFHHVDGATEAGRCYFCTLRRRRELAVVLP